MKGSPPFWPKPIAPSSTCFLASATLKSRRDPSRLFSTWSWEFSVMGRTMPSLPGHSGPGGTLAKTVCDHAMSARTTKLAHLFVITVLLENYFQRGFVSRPSDGCNPFFQRHHLAEQGSQVQAAGGKEGDGLGKGAAAGADQGDFVHHHGGQVQIGLAVEGALEHDGG